MSKAMEGHYLAELHALRSQAEERAKAGERLTPNRADKTKEPALAAPKPIQPSLHPSLSSAHHPVPTLVSAHGMYLGPGGAGPGALTPAMALQRANEEERWQARQRKLRQEKEDRQYQVSEFRQQVLEQHLDIGRPGEANELRTEGHRPLPNHHEPSSRDRERDIHPHLGAPPPLISPKPQHRDHGPPPPTTLWNPASLIETSSDPRRSLHDPQGLGHYDISRLPPPPTKPERHYVSDKPDDMPRRKDLLEKYPSIRPTGFSEPSTFLAELEKSTQTFLNQQRATLSLSSQYGDLSSSLKSCVAHKGLQMPPRPSPEPMFVYDEFLQQHRQPVSKLDMEERRRREAREKGYYYELDESYDESDEEEVRAHLRRVAEQAPLKLDDSTEKVEFLRMFGLTTVSRRDDLLEQKRKKRRRMLRERSPSPPAVAIKRPTPPATLSTRFTPEEMDNSPELEDKKQFLTMFSLNHLTMQQRRENERMVELLQAIKQKSVTLDNIRHNPNPLCKSPSTQNSDPSSSSSPGQTSDPVSARPPSPPAPVGPSLPADPSATPDHLRPLPDPLRAKEPPLPHSHPDKGRGSEAAPGKKPSSLLNSMRPPLHPKDGSGSLNGRTKPWESFTAEEFAQQFHESVLQSTQKALQKHKGGTSAISEPNHTVDSSVHYNIPELQSGSGRTTHPHIHAAHQPNGQHCPPGPRREGPMLTTRPELSAEEDSEEGEDEEEEEEEAPGSRWQGIEAIFEAYQEYAEEQSIEREVLHTQCRRLEAQHYNLSLTAEQLSLSMGELMAQKQKLAAEREKLQAELEHFKKYLTLPQSPWSRAHFKGYPPR